MLTKRGDYIDRSFIVKTLLPVLCCPHDIPPGVELTIISRPSPNRLMVRITKDFSENFQRNFCHKVKRSALNRCCEEIL